MVGYCRVRLSGLSLIVSVTESLQGLHSKTWPYRWQHPVSTPAGSSSGSSSDTGEDGLPRTDTALLLLELKAIYFELKANYFARCKHSATKETICSVRCGNNSIKRFPAPDW